MAAHTIFGIGVGREEVDLPEADWQFHVWTDRTVWGIDQQRRFPPVRIFEDINDGHRVKVTWPRMDEVPEDVRWKL